MKICTLSILMLMFSCIPMPAQPTGDVTKDIAQMNAAFKDLQYCYYGQRDGEVLNNEDSDRICKKAIEKIKSFKGTYGAKYPIFFNLVFHLIYSLGADSYNACRNLQNGMNTYLALSNKPRVAANGIRKTYYDSFGIDSTFIVNFYNSDYCMDLGIYIDVPCPSRTIKEESAKPPLPENPLTPKTQFVNSKPMRSNIPSGGYLAVTDSMSLIKLPNGESFKDPNPVELLRMVLSMKYSSDILEVEEMLPGDARLVPGQAGVPYEVRLKNAKAKEIIHFEAGKYYITDETMVQNDTLWTAYMKSISEFNQLVIWVLNKYGNNAFHIFVQGSADRPTFTPKELHTNFNSDQFTQMTFWTVNAQTKTVSKGGRVITGKKYNNNDLPDLRGAFMRYMMLQNSQLKAWPDKITQIAGTVKPYDDSGKRNCCILVYIDWDKALNR